MMIQLKQRVKKQFKVKTEDRWKSPHSRDIELGMRSNATEEKIESRKK